LAAIFLFFDCNRSCRLFVTISYGCLNTSFSFLWFICSHVINSRLVFDLDRFLFGTFCPLSTVCSCLFCSIRWIGLHFFQQVSDQHFNFSRRTTWLWPNFLPLLALRSFLLLLTLLFSGLLSSDLFLCNVSHDVIAFLFHPNQCSHQIGKLESALPSGLHFHIIFLIFGQVFLQR